MSTYVLIHGAFHGGWCWYKVVAELERRGHVVIAPDLPGNARDRTPLAQVTLEAYVSSVCATLDQQIEPVILVGHSMGGVTITQVAEARPGKIRQLVYVAAFLPRNGATALETLQQDAGSSIAANLVIDADGCATIPAAALKETFYNDCADADIALARLSLTPQSLLPAQVPVNTSAENYDSVPRAYIECLLDHALSPAVQKSMYTATPCQRVISMNTSHSPFFSAAEALADHLTSF